MSVYFQQDEGHILVTGKTYPYRELMRSLGGQYQAADKSWLVPHNPKNLEQIQELCRSVGGGKNSAAAASPQKSTAAAKPSLPTDPSQDKEPSLKVEGLSISELMQEAQMAMAQAFPRSVWVMGEIQNIRMHASGIYFQLADFKEGASRSATMTVSATLWRSQFTDLERKLGRDTLRELLQDGMRVRVLVDVGLYKDRGQITLQVQTIDPQFTKGSLALAREKLLRELRSKGVDQQNKALTLSAFPFSLGLISAPDSRAQSDFLDQLAVYRFPGQVTFFPAQMQGEKTLEDVARGLKYLAEQGCDLIVLTRGGGSAADLRWFDSPEIAYAIALCPVPVIAAIGHHEDVCVAEEIAYRREKTPTAAADFVVSHFQKTRERLDQLSRLLSRGLEERIRLQDQILQNLRSRLLMGSQQTLSLYQRGLQQVSSVIEMQVQRRLVLANSQLGQLRQQLMQISRFHLQADDNKLRICEQNLRNFAYQSLQRANLRPAQLGQELGRLVQQRIFRERERLLEAEKLIAQRDPKPWLSQGWTQLLGPGGRILSIQDAPPGTEVQAPLLDGTLHLTVSRSQVKPLAHGAHT